MKSLKLAFDRLGNWKAIVVAVAIILGIAGADALESTSRHRDNGLKLQAAELALRSMKAIKQERLERKLPIDPISDPTESGMVGMDISPVTSIKGKLSAKQTSVNPNFAAVIVEYLQQAGVREGDCVAVGWTGSFPAINVSVAAALETMKVRPVCVASAASSQWGANLPSFLWLDMERILVDRKLISFRSVAASLGGVADRAKGMTDSAHQTFHAAIDRHKLAFIEVKSRADSIEKRMKIYRECAAGRPIKAYINVGGGTVSVGQNLADNAYLPGLNRSLPKQTLRTDSVMKQFLTDGVPVIHLTQIEELAGQFGLAIRPTELPAVGEGAVYEGDSQYPWLITATPFLLLTGLYTVTGRKSKSNDA